MENTVSNYVPLTAYLPKERDKIIAQLQYVIDFASEEEMLAYRRNLRSL